MRMKYSGALARKSSLQRLKVDGTPNSAERVAHSKRGLKLLCEHYGIEESDPTDRFLLLALCLAHDWVPYFKVPGRRGRPKAEAYRWVQLEMDIAARRLAGDKSDAAALDYLTRHNTRWRGKNADPSNLARRRREHKNDMLVKDVRGLAKTVLAMRRNLSHQ